MRERSKARAAEAAREVGLEEGGAGTVHPALLPLLHSQAGPAGDKESARDRGKAQSQGRQRGPDNQAP